MKYNIRRLCYKRAMEITYHIDKARPFGEFYGPHRGYLVFQKEEHLNKDYVLKEIFEKEGSEYKYHDFNIEDIVIKTLTDNGILKSEVVDTIESDCIINKDTFDAIDYEGTSYPYRISYDVSKDEYNIVLDNNKDSDITEIDEEFYDQVNDFMREENIWEEITTRMEDHNKPRGIIRSFLKSLRS